MTGEGRDATFGVMKKILFALALLMPLAASARENAHDTWNKDIAAFQDEDRAHPVSPGAVLFVGAAIGKVTIEATVKALLPFYLALFLVLMMVTYIPAISLWLPSVVL